MPLVTRVTNVPPTVPAPRCHWHTDAGVYGIAHLTKSNLLHQDRGLKNSFKLTIKVKKLQIWFTLLIPLQTVYVCECICACVCVSVCAWVCVRKRSISGVVPCHFPSHVLRQGRWLNLELSHSERLTVQQPPLWSSSCLWHDSAGLKCAVLRPAFLTASQ